MELFLQNTMGLFVVFTMSKIPKFFCNVSCNVMVFAPCTIFTIATPDNCSGNGAAIFTYLLQPGFRVNDSSGKMGIALFRNLNSECLALCSPSTSCMFFIPKTRSISSCISDTKVNISNLWFLMLTIIGITKRVATLFPLPTCKHLMCVSYLGRECRVGFFM